VPRYGGQATGQRRRPGAAAHDESSPGATGLPDETFHGARIRWGRSRGPALSAYLFTSYYPDSPLLVPFLVADYALAGLTASLRVASGMHFVTDVVAGAVIGTAFDFLLPVLHQR